MQLDRETVALQMQRALASESAILISWRCEPIGVPTGKMTGGVYRVSGTALDNGIEVEWSLVLKVVAAPDSGAESVFNDPARPLYWKREVLVFQSDLLDALPGGVEAPKCFATIEQPDGSYWLCLEDVKDSYDWRWPLEQYGRAARTLGRFNGAYLAGKSMPDYPWLVRSGSPRGLLDHNTWILDAVKDPNTWRHPLLREDFPAELVDKIARLWEDREVLLLALDRLPHTFCHLDAWRGNLFARQMAENKHSLVAIDWAFPGRGVVGTDAGDLFAPSFGMFGVEMTEPGMLDRMVFESYLEGLREAGWEGDRRMVRFAFAAFSALKYGCFVPWTADAQDEGKYGTWERLSGHTMAEFLHNQSVLIHYLLDLADEARNLLAEGRW